IEVDLGDHADVLPRPLVDGDHRLRADLVVAAEPDDAGIDGAGGPPRIAALGGRLHRELHDGNHAAEGLRQLYVLHVRLQVPAALLERDRSGSPRSSTLGLGSCSTSTLPASSST